MISDSEITALNAYFRHLDALYLDAVLLDELFVGEKRVQSFNQKAPYAISRIQNALQFHVLLTFSKLYEGDDKLSLLSIRKMILPSALNKTLERKRTLIQELAKSDELTEWRNSIGAHFSLDAFTSGERISAETSTERILEVIDLTKEFVIDCVKERGWDIESLFIDRRTGYKRKLAEFAKRLEEF